MDKATDIWNEELFAAIERGHVDTVKELINLGANINARNKKRQSPLELAIKTQQLEVVDILLSAGVDPFANSHLRYSALWHAIENLNSSSEAPREMQLNILRRLLETGVITRDPEGQTWHEALDYAVRNGHLDAVSVFLEFGVDPNLAAFTAIQEGHYDIFLLSIEFGCNVQWDTVYIPLDVFEARKIAFEAAARSCSTDLVRHFLDAGADPNIQVKEIPIVLCAAAESGNAEVVRMLIDAGAYAAGTAFSNPYWTTYSLLSGPISKGNVHVLELLLGAGAPSGEALNIAVTFGNQKLVEWLIERETDINATNQRGETALMEAVWADSSLISLALVDWLLSHGAGVNHVDKHGYTALKRAAGSPELVSKLIAAGADPNGGWGITALMLASVQSLECVRLLLDVGADVNAVTEDGDTAWRIANASGLQDVADLLAQVGGSQEPAIAKTHLHAAILWKKTHDILRLIQEGVDIESLDSDGRTPLLSAIQSQCELVVIDALLNAGAAPNRLCIGVGNDLPLESAVGCESPEVVRSLLAHGADPNRTGSPLPFAVTVCASAAEEPENGAKRMEVVRLLLEAGAFPNVYCDGAGMTPLHEAAIYGHLPLIELLLDHGADIEMRNASDNTCGFTALNEACWRGQFEAAQYLIERGADVNTCGDYGGTPLNNVCKRRFSSESSCVVVVDETMPEDEIVDRDEAVIKLAELLIRHGADVNADNGHGGTPLLSACFSGNSTFSESRCALIRVLLDAGASVNVEDEWGMTPLAYARESGAQTLVDMLAAYGAN